jgi:hypothetical protein
MEFAGYSAEPICVLSHLMSQSAYDKGMKLNARWQKVAVIALPLLLFGVSYHIYWGLIPSGNTRLLQHTLARVDKVEFFDCEVSGYNYLALNGEEAHDFISTLCAYGWGGGSETDSRELWHAATLKFYEGSHLLATMELRAQVWAPTQTSNTYDVRPVGLQIFNYCLVWRGRTIALRRGTSDFINRHRFYEHGMCT